MSKYYLIGLVIAVVTLSLGFGLGLWTHNIVYPTRDVHQQIYHKYKGYSQQEDGSYEATVLGGDNVRGCTRNAICQVK